VPEDGNRETRFFPPELVPVAGHPRVKELPPQVFEEILVQHLYRYLDFTARLEHFVVNRTVLGIAHGTVGVRVPEDMRLDAFKMYCDEAYHALCAVDLARQVRRRTSMTPHLPDEPFFMRRLRQIQEETPSEYRALTELLFVIVSETLISASLAEVPSDGEVDASVRETIRDHAADEGRHHAYFAVFLHHLWGQMEREERRLAALLLPRLMDAFLHPDLEATHLELTGYGLSAESSWEILDEVYSPAVLSEHARSTSRQTRHYLEEIGVFDQPGVEEELRSYGFAD
jgi:hypothetical protein